MFMFLLFPMALLLGNGRRRTLGRDILRCVHTCHCSEMESQIHLLFKLFKRVKNMLRIFLFCWFFVFLGFLFVSK